jgi:hypothetical protein
MIGVKQRPLRVTLHTETLSDVHGQTKEAIDTIYELSQFDDIDLLDFEGIITPSINIFQNDLAKENITLKIVHPSGEILSWHSGVNRSRISPARIQAIFGYYGTESTEFKESNRHLFCLEAHWGMYRDIFVTLSPYLLTNRSALDYANVRTPTEATAIIGLLLRSRDNWAYRKAHNATCITDRRMFFWVLTRSKLPKCWKFFSALFEAQKTHGITMLNIGQSMLERCFRTLQARDEIAKQFYLNQDINTRDLTMYHFDYLTLLLSGAFDAEAAIANLVYGLGLKDFDVSFRKQSFIDALNKSHAQRLVSEVTSPRCCQLMIMLHKLRNTIHSAGLNTYGLVQLSRPEASFATVPESFRDKLEQAAISLGGLDCWGLRHDNFLVHNSETGINTPSYEISIEPYTYASRLVDEWFSLIDDIAGAIEVERLLPAGWDDSQLSSTPDEWLQMITRYSVLTQ